MGSSPSKAKPESVSKTNSTSASANTGNQKGLQPDSMSGASTPSRSNTGFEERSITPRETVSKGGKSSSKSPKAGKSVRMTTPGTPNTSAPDADFHGLIGNMQRQKTMMMQREKTQIGAQAPSYEADDIVMETFYHKDGRLFDCVYQSGQRFYLDFNEHGSNKEWLPFPAEWKDEGVIVTEKVLEKEEVQEQEQASTSNQDDREGTMTHPTKGVLQTYMFEEKRNVHYYFDTLSGCWVRIPLAWELRHDLVKTLLGPIQEAMPKWKDRFDMLAALRASNYDPHDCMATYMAYGDDYHIQTGHTKADSEAMDKADHDIKDLQDQTETLKAKLGRKKQKLADERKEKLMAQDDIKDLRTRVSELEAEMGKSHAQLEAYQRQVKDTETKAKKAAVSPDTIQKLNSSVTELHKDYSQLKMLANNDFDDLKQMFKQVAVGMKRFTMANKESSNELSEMRELYRREALQRKLLYNKLQELRGNIRVFARCRRDDRTKCCLRFPDDETVLAPDSSKPYKFDKVFKTDSTQEQIFEDTLPIIQSCVDGYNVCIMAYGQTGSGKTFTMQGPKDNPGVNVRAIRELITICKERDNVNYTLKASMVEIYNENIQDLLTSDARVLDLKAQGNKIVLPGLTEMVVENQDDIDTVFSMGDKNRHVAATKMNSTSSRSHLVFRITVEGVDAASGAISTGTLTLCDLAGSERVSKTDAQGARLVEAAAINKSLSALGQVFTALRTGQLHIPYRNSKLTHMLQPSLGGDAKACLFVALSPDQSNAPESVSTMLFGSNARQVQLGQAKKNVRQGPN